MKAGPQDLVRGITRVASLPAVYIKLNEAIGNPLSSSRDLERIVSEDAALTARLLRIANSALYGFPSRIETISHAITVLGFQQLHDLTLGCSVVSIFRDVSPDLVDMESFWRHSVACGVAARILASFRREPNAERYLVAGLLHDIGRLILFLERPELARQALYAARERGELLYRMERELFGFDHADVGAALLQAWRVPVRLAEAVRYHHAPQRAGDSMLDASVVHLADIVANAMGYGSSGERYVPPLHAESLRLVGLPVSIIDPTLDQLSVQYAEAVGHILGRDAA